MSVAARFEVRFTAFLDGVHGDTNQTFLVGDVAEEARLLVERTREAAMRGVKAIAPSPVIESRRKWRRCTRWSAYSPRLSPAQITRGGADCQREERRFAGRSDLRRRSPDEPRSRPGVRRRHLCVLDLEDQ